MNDVTPAAGAWDISLSPWAARLDERDKDYQLAIELGDMRAGGMKFRDMATWALGECRPGRLRLWLKAKPERLAAYEAGYEARNEDLADDLLDIADKQEIGETITVGPKGRTVKTEDMLGHRALRIDARKFLIENSPGSLWGKKSGSMSVQAVGNITIIHESQ